MRHWYFMREIVTPARTIQGAITLPGDKSISHRYGMLAGIAEGRTTITNYSTGADCQSTLGCMAALGARVTRARRGAEDAVRVVVEGGALKARLARSNGGGTGRGQFGLDDPHVVRHFGGAGVRFAHRRR